MRLNQRTQDSHECHADSRDFEHPRWSRPWSPLSLRDHTGRIVKEFVAGAKGVEMMCGLLPW